MEALRNLAALPDLGPRPANQRFFWSLMLISLVPVVIVLPMTPPRIGVAVMGAWIALIWVVITFLRDRVENIALFWLACYPYCYYFLSFPHNQTLFTVDRAVIALLVAYMLVASKREHLPLSSDLHLSAWLWGLYVFTCLCSLAGQPIASPFYSSCQIVLNGLILPAFLALYTMRYFPALSNISRLHSCACVLSIGICSITVAELITGSDILPWPGAAPYLLGSYVQIRRADGPFEMPAILSIIALLVFLLILYLRRLLPGRLSHPAAILHVVGASAALLAAFAPLNRGLLLALIPIAVIDITSKHRLMRVSSWVLLSAVVLVCAVTAKAFYPDIYEDRTTQPDNVYQRIAQDQETLRVVAEHPFFGVGVGLYHDTVSQDARYLARWNGIESMNWPHNVLMTILAENGLVGLSLFISSQFFLVRAMWKIRRRHPVGWLAFLYCFLAYTLYGLDFSINYYPDVTLLYMFIVGLVFQIQGTAGATSASNLSSSGEQLFPAVVRV
ncbi:MAG: O-antigen ligase family protein [Acidobacteriaceae bacterium]